MRFAGDTGTHFQAHTTSISDICTGEYTTSDAACRRHTDDIDLQSKIQKTTTSKNVDPLLTPGTIGNKIREAIGFYGNGPNQITNTHTPKLKNKIPTKYPHKVRHYNLNILPFTKLCTACSHLARFFIKPVFHVFPNSVAGPIFLTASRGAFF